MSVFNDPSNRLLRFRQALDRLIDDEMPDPHDSLSGSGNLVPVDVYVHAHHVEILVELPGTPAEHVEVAATGSQLTIEGIRPARPRVAGRTLCLESAVGRFRRNVELPVPADTRRAVATLRAGVLQICVPRIEDRRGGAHRIPVIRP